MDTFDAPYCPGGNGKTVFNAPYYPTVMQNNCNSNIDYTLSKKCNSNIDYIFRYNKSQISKFQI